ncbi:MAG: hypothetical protein IH968_19500 [Gemmatimonadetes bacterium]|nr:hypothetical protein [Gemmatimonadota bacterium]
MKAENQYEAANRITVGELREMLRFYSDDTELTIGPATNAEPLVFTRVKCRGPNLIQIEVAEARELMDCVPRYRPLSGNWWPGADGHTKVGHGRPDMLVSPSPPVMILD